MVREAELERTEHGVRPRGDGWFVLNAADACWLHSDKLGSVTRFEGATAFPQIGINLRVLQPGQPNGYYHRENQQEGFLVLQGTCRLIVEGQERLLEAWDFFHCPPDTAHIVVGAGDGPCVVLMVGYRDAHEKLLYPVEPLALRHGAGVREETTSPDEAYAGIPARRPIPAPAPFA